MPLAKLYQLRPGGPYYAERFDFDARVWRRRSTSHRSERAAQKVADEWLREGEDIEAGVTSSSQHHRGKGINAHIEAFIESRASRRGAKQKHIAETRRRLERVADEAGWGRLDAIDQDGLVTAVNRISDRIAAEAARKRESREARRRAKLAKTLAKEQARSKAAREAIGDPGAAAEDSDAVLRPTESAMVLQPSATPAPGLSNATINAFRRAWRSFTRWCHRSGRLSKDPLSEWERLPTDGFESFKRRALSWDEFDRLFHSTNAGPERGGLSGADRAMLYLTAVSTGFRLNELTSLEARSFMTERSPPVVRLGAEHAKNAKPVLQPLPAVDIDRFRGWLAGKRPGQKLWPRIEAAAELVRLDLEAAGVSVVDGDGHRADFHALRHTFGTWLALGGVMPQLCQRLMRHSSMDLTMRLYTHLGLADLSQAVQRGIGTTRCAGAARFDDATQVQTRPDAPTNGPDGDEAPESQPSEGVIDMAPEAPTNDQTRPDASTCADNARSGTRTRDLPLRSQDEPPLKRLKPQEVARDESGSAAPARRDSPESKLLPNCYPGGSNATPEVTRGLGKDPSKPLHARERAEAGLEPDLDTAMARVRATGDLARPQARGAA